MTDTTRTDITLILDNSCSMFASQEATREAVNAFLLKQKETAGQCYFSLATFDTPGSLHFIIDRKRMAEVQPLTQATYNPTGNSTALCDAIGISIERLGKQYYESLEHNRPGKVIVVIMTDGQENSSVQFNRARISEMVTHQREKYSWDFIFLGADQDAISEGVKLGMLSDYAMTYSKSHKGVINTMDTVSYNVSQARTATLSGQASTLQAFTKQDREKAVEND